MTFLKVVAAADHLTQVSTAAPGHILEQVQVFSILHMVPDSAVARAKAHVTSLSLASEQEDALIGPVVKVTVSLALGPGEQKYKWAVPGSADAALPLPSMPIM